MLLRQKPEHIEDFIVVDNEINTLLQESGRFLPFFLYKNQFYYLKTQELVNFIREGGEMFERIKIFC